MVGVKKYSKKTVIFGDIALNRREHISFIQCHVLPNFGFNCDKYPANYCVIFYGSEVISVFNFVVGTCALSG